MARLGEGEAAAFSPDGKWVLAFVPRTPAQLVLSHAHRGRASDRHRSLRGDRLGRLVPRRAVGPLLREPGRGSLPMLDPAARGRNGAGGHSRRERAGDSSRPTVRRSWRPVRLSATAGIRSREGAAARSLDSRPTTRCSARAAWLPSTWLTTSGMSATSRSRSSSRSSPPLLAPNDSSRDQDDRDAAAPPHPRPDRQRRGERHRLLRDAVRRG